MDQFTATGFGEYPNPRGRCVERTEDKATIGSSLYDLFGTWSRAEAEAFNEALEVFETVDESAWK